ncbi:hypothetical protein EDB85DRAFT_1298805 [Lactarius pseudohatsudake]|nr:hypothetical protein EDB85DRAFT_1298805 [Lactarius pseudohatsudake]
MVQEVTMATMMGNYDKATTMATAIRDRHGLEEPVRVTVFTLTQAQAQAAQATFRPRRKTTKKVTMFELIPTWLSYHIGLIPTSPSQATSPSLDVGPSISLALSPWPFPSHPILPPNTVSLFIRRLVQSPHYIISNRHQLERQQQRPPTKTTHFHLANGPYHRPGLSLREDSKSRPPLAVAPEDLDDNIMAKKTLLSATLSHFWN